MNITFRVNQVAALASGIDAPQPQVTLPIDPASLTNEQRAILASRLNTDLEVCHRNPNNGGFTVGNTSGYETPGVIQDRTSNYPQRPKLTGANAPTLEALFEAIAEEERAVNEVAVEKARKAAAAAEERRVNTQAVLDERRTKTRNAGIQGCGEVQRDGERVYYDMLYPDWPYDSDPAVKLGYDGSDWEAEIDSQNEATRLVAEARLAAILAQKAAEKQAEADRAKAKRDYRVAWIKEHGTDEQRERLAEGLLPSSETMALIEAEALAPLKDFAGTAESPSCDDERCNGDEYDNSEACTDIDYDSEPFSGPLSAVQFATLKRIREAVPGAAIERRKYTAVHSCNHNADGCNIGWALGVRVTITQGPFEFSRNLAL